MVADTTFSALKILEVVWGPLASCSLFHSLAGLKAGLRAGRSYHSSTQPLFFAENQPGQVRKGERCPL